MATIRVFRNKGIVVCSNFVNNCVADFSVFSIIATERPTTLVVHRFDRNAEFYYVNKYKFPTVRTVVYFGSWTPQDVDGLYGFDKVLVSKHFRDIYMGKNFRYMTPEEERMFGALGQNLSPEVEKSRHIMASANAGLYFGLMRTPPSLEIVE